MHACFLVLKKIPLYTQDMYSLIFTIHTLNLNTLNTDNMYIEHICIHYIYTVYTIYSYSLTFSQTGNIWHYILFDIHLDTHYIHYIHFWLYILHIYIQYSLHYIFFDIHSLTIYTRWSVAMHFAPGSAGVVFSSGVSVNGKWRRFTL
jgi:hypothetical protein